MSLSSQYNKISKKNIGKNRWSWLYLRIINFWFILICSREVSNNVYSSVPYWKKGPTFWKRLIILKEIIKFFIFQMVYLLSRKYTIRKIHKPTNLSIRSTITSFWTNKIVTCERLYPPQVWPRLVFMWPC